jgi:hypothetical protein
MKKIMYEVGPDYIDVGGLGKARQDGQEGDRMFRDAPVSVTDEKAADMLTNAMFKEQVEVKVKVKQSST